MENYLDLMKSSDLMSLINQEKIKQYLSEGSLKIGKYETENIVHFSGEICSKLEIILSGKVGIERIDEYGNLMTIVEFMNNDILGGNLLFSRNPYYQMTVTSKKPTIILEISKSLLMQLFSSNNKFLMIYLEYVSDHATILGDKIKHYIKRTIRESVISYLEQERKKQNSSIIKLNITKKALAERLGVQRTSLSRELAKMRDDGLINFDSISVELLI